MIKRIKFYGVPVSDQDRALKFYTQKLGFVVTTDVPMVEGQQRWIELSIPGAETGLSLFTAEGHDKQIGTFQNMSFETDDVQKTYEELKALGVEFADSPTEQFWGTHAIFLDPDKNRFVIWSPPKFSGKS